MGPHNQSVGPRPTPRSFFSELSVLRSPLPIWSGVSQVFRWDCYRLLGVLSEPDANLLHDMQVRLSVSYCLSLYVVFFLLPFVGIVCSLGGRDAAPPPCVFLLFPC